MIVAHGGLHHVTKWINAACRDELHPSFAELVAGAVRAGLMQKIDIEPHPSIRTIRPDLPDCLASILDRALEKEPEQRFANGAEMAQSLRDCGQTIDPALR